jgi:hypothetical protein
VLSAVRLGCDLDYDALQDLAEQHRALRQIMGLGDWDDESFHFRRIHDNICLVCPQTITAIDRLILAEGHRLALSLPTFYASSRPRVQSDSRGDASIANASRPNYLCFLATLFAA